MNTIIERLKNKLAVLPDPNQIYIYCDMDGVLAQWDKACSPEVMYAKDYFYNMMLEPSVRDALLLLHKAGYPVSILSAAATEGYARGDKTRWLEKHGMSHLPRTYSALGQNKTDAIEIKPGVTYLLLDDYNPNLLAWGETHVEGAKFVPIKFLNGINGGTGTWQGRTVYHRSNGEAIANALADAVIMAALTK